MLQMKKIKFTSFLTVVFFVLLQANSFAQCAMCRASVSSTLSDGRNDVGNGINTGILYLLSAPYLLVAGLIWLWYSQAKKNQILMKNV
jgi:hypothetical protein